MDNDILLECTHRFSSDRGRLLENAVFLDLRRQGLEVYRWCERREVDFLVWHKTQPAAAINACAELTDTRHESVRWTASGRSWNGSAWTGAPS